MGEKKRVLFLCTHNSARSQMAEGLLRHLAGDRFEAMSAGTEATRVRPLADQGDGGDRHGHLGTGVQDARPVPEEPFDYVITVCDDANEACPFFPGAEEQAALVLRGPLKGRGHGGGAPGGLPFGEGPDSGADRRRPRCYGRGHANFLERRQREVRRMILPRTPVNKGAPAISNGDGRVNLRARRSRRRRPPSPLARREA